MVSHDERGFPVDSATPPRRPDREMGWDRSGRHLPRCHTNLPQLSPSPSIRAALPALPGFPPFCGGIQPAVTFRQCRAAGEVSSKGDRMTTPHETDATRSTTAPGGSGLVRGVPGMTGGAPAPRPGTPLGVKLLMGCIGVVVLGLVGVAVAIGIGAFAISRGVDAVAEHARDQQEATALLDRLERDYRFSPPANGEVTPTLERRFAAVTERAWPGMRRWAEEARRLDARAADRPGRQANLGDAVTAARTASGVVQARVVLARALEKERMSLSEYLWTGHALQAGGPERLGRTARDAEDVDLVLRTAALWGRAEGLRSPR